MRGHWGPKVYYALPYYKPTIQRPTSPEKICEILILRVEMCTITVILEALDINFKASSVILSDESLVARETPIMTSRVARQRRQRV